jgi:hypothetical protein
LLFAFETIVDLIFLADIFITFMSPSERIDGSYETNYKKLARNYFFGFFVIDCWAVFPTQFFEVFGAPEAPTGLDIIGSHFLLEQTRKAALYKLIRVLRVFKLIKLLKYYSRLNKMISKLNINRSTIRIMNIMILALFMVHIFACFFYLSAKMHDFSSDTWVVQRDDLDTRGA